MYFKNHDYNDYDLGAPRGNYPLDGATLIEWPPLGGEGYQRNVNSMVDRFDVFISRDKRDFR